jgi:hypothetical protein
VVLALVIAAFEIVVNQAWWTFALVVFALVVVALGPLGSSTAIVLAGAIGGLALLGGMGVFFIFLGGFVGLWLMLGGIAALVVAIVGLAVAVRYARGRLNLGVEPKVSPSRHR